MTRRRSIISLTLAWLVAGIVLVLSMWWGRRLQIERPEIFLGAAPFVGRDPLDGWDWRFGFGLVGAAAVAAALVWSLWSGRWWRWPSTIVGAATSVAAAAFSVSLALTDGSDGLLRGATHDSEYLVNLEIAPPPLEFLRTFVADIQRYSVHVRGHPPGFVLVLQALDAIGLDGAWPVVALSIAGTMLLPAAVLTAVAALAGDHWMRAVAPVLVVSPYALWMMTSADAVYAAVGAWAVAACVLGLRTTGAISMLWGTASGLLLGALLFLTYGGATFSLVLLVPFGVAAFRRLPGSWPTGLSVVGGVAVVTVVFAALGFWWLDGALETRRQYWAGTAQFRPFGYFAIANLAVSLVAIGPLGYAGLLRLYRDRRNPPPVWPLVVGGLVALLASHASQYTRAEVERIWLLFFPWIVVAAGALVEERHPVRTSAAVALQAASAIALQAVLVSKW